MCLEISSIANVGQPTKHPPSSFEFVLANVPAGRGQSHGLCNK